MNPDRGRIEDIWSRFTCGEPLGADEERILVEAMSADSGLRDELMEDEGTDGMLAALVRAEEDAEGFARAFAGRLAAERDGTRFLEMVRQGIRSEKSRTGRRRTIMRTRREWRPFWPAAAAACMLAAVAAILATALGRGGIPAARPRSGDSTTQAAGTVPTEQAAPRNVAEEPAREPVPEPSEIQPSAPDRTPQAAPEPERFAERTPPPQPPQRRDIEEPPVEPAAPERRDTLPAIAKLEQIRGQVFVLEGRSRSAAKPGSGLQSGRGIQTSGGDGLAVISLPDGTRIELGGDSSASRIIDDGKERRIVLERGVLEAEAARQPAHRPMIFETPHAEARILGTRLRLSADGASTRLEVREGRVRFIRLSDGKSVDVVSGQYAVVGPAHDFASRPLPIDEIMLLPRNARIVGVEWRLVKDEEASTGAALENMVTANNILVRNDQDRERVNRWFQRGMSRSWVVFTFNADADRDYRLWVRGRCMQAGTERSLHDDVMMEVSGGRFLGRPADWYPYADFLCPVQGFGQHQGYWWSGGAHDPSKTQTPIMVRFNRPGPQVMRMHGSEPPMRVDAIWLSSTQDRRPEASLHGSSRR